MSLIHMNVFSKVLNMMTSVNIVLPLPARADIPVEPMPVLYLLHGLGDNATAWQRKTNVERYALKAGLAVVMPDGALSCYENMAHGQRYRDYIENELPEMLCGMFPLSRRREDTFIAGCSMGGCGALKLALHAPEKYSAVGCFSAAHFEYRSSSPTQTALLERAYGDRLADAENEIAEDAVSVSKGSLPLRVWHACGDADTLKTNALVSKEYFERLSSPALSYHFEELEGIHDWALWDDMLRRFIPWLGLQRPDCAVM